MKSKTFRSIAAVAVMTLAVGALYTTVALGATKYELKFAAQPQDAEAGATITSADLVAGNSFVQVKLMEGSTLVTNNKSLVTFTLATGEVQPGITAATGRLDVQPQPLINGVATFGAGTLKILDKNEPQFTSYSLIPITTKNPLITGPASAGFDVWQEGDSCTGGSDVCEANLREGEDTYTLNAAGTLGASELPGALPGLVCDRQDEIFPNTVFSYATTGSSTAVFLENHISQDVWRASANNGQAHADWCVGLLTSDPWVRNGADFELKDTNGSAPGGSLYVALAPKCPVANPENFAPCIVSQNSDGMGGSTTLGWLPAGDPPRRT